MAEEISKGYLPGDVETQWYDRWLAGNCFRADEAGKAASYSIVIPPPNVTGILHLGHVLNNTIQDVLARRARMEGKDVLWLPGTDHAGIATQTKVEQQLRKEEGKTRRDLGREAFLERVWEWKEKHGGIIIEQLKRLGCSCDWSRERFTMDERYSRWISKVFVDLFQDGLIYRGKRMVNWCPKSLTALSDEEVIMKPQRSKLYTMRYRVAPLAGPGKGSNADDTDLWIEIATTRPETIMGDTAVAVHPKDKRYAKLIGRHAIRPFPEAEIPIIGDDSIDPEFGTGALKVTPAHDKVDFAIGLKHGLPILDVFHPDGTLNDLAGPGFAGLDRFEARKKAAAKLEELGLLIKTEDYENNVGYSERADVPIEPRLSMQWFLKYPCVEEAAAAVANDEIRFRPERWKKTYAHWMEGIQDWCISRQLWWGHQIPVWYRRDKADELQARESLDSRDAAEDIYVGIDPPGDPENWVRDNDVLDTWFSSWLWPFATMSDSDAEPSATEKKFYPTTDLVTAPEILFFWVARMIMAGYRWRGELPFKNVFFTGIVRDGKGRKMSKSLGNSPDPLDIISEYGADALRFAMMKTAPLGADIRFEITNEGGKELYPQVVEGRNFANKLWNAARFRQMQEGEPAVSLDPATLSIYAIDILAQLDDTEQRMRQAYEDYRFNELAQILYEFWWSQYCDWFLESCKGDLAPGADPAVRAATLATMDLVMRRFLLLVHPFMPHLSEELWDKLGCRLEGEPAFLMQTALPTAPVLEGIPATRVKKAREQVKAIYETVGRARNLKAEYGLGANKGVTFILDPGKEPFSETAVLQLLAGAAEVKVEPGYAAAQGVPAALSPLGKLYLPLDGLIDVAAERDRLGKELAKAEDELKKVNAKLSNENFVSRAPDEVVAEMKDRRKQWQSRCEELKRMMENLGS
jgi:valyl-tRNA synthetase